jgi:hypothetical protein
LPLVDSQNDLVGIVSQWDIVNFLNQHKSRPELVRQVRVLLAALQDEGRVLGLCHSTSDLSSLARARVLIVKQMNKSLHELDLAPGKVVSVSHRATLKDCFTAIMGFRTSLSLSHVSC